MCSRIPSLTLERSIATKSGYETGLGCLNVFSHYVLCIGKSVQRLAFRLEQSRVFGADSEQMPFSKTGV